MAEEENPFLINRKLDEKPKTEDKPSTDFMVDFMVTSEEAASLKDKKLEIDSPRPHLEEAGTPVWDRKHENLDNPSEEIVEHDD